MHRLVREVNRTRYARSGALRIAYELRGTVHRRWPWLVLIQGMGLDRLGWEPVLRKLRRRFRLVLVDNRGVGHSDRPDGSFTVADMAGDIVAVLDAAGIRKAHVLGASLGGMVAQELALSHPERVDGLVLACTAPGWPFAYPMPAASLRAIASSARMTAEAARRRHTENALAAGTVRAPSGTRDPPPGAPGLPASGRRRAAGPGGRGSTVRRRTGNGASVPALWSCTAARTASSTRATAGCSRTASRGPGS